MFLLPSGGPTMDYFVVTLATLISFYVGIFHFQSTISTEIHRRSCRVDTSASERLRSAQVLGSILLDQDQGVLVFCLCYSTC